MPKPEASELDGELRADELGLRRRLHEALHPAILIPFPMQEQDRAELRRIEHFADGFADRLVKMMHTGVDERRPLVGDEELIERGAVRLLPRRDAVVPFAIIPVSEFCAAGAIQNLRRGCGPIQQQVVHQRETRSLPSCESHWPFCT